MTIMKRFKNDEDWFPIHYDMGKKRLLRRFESEEIDERLEKGETLEDEEAFYKLKTITI